MELNIYLEELAVLKKAICQSFEIIFLVYITNDFKPKTKPAAMTYTQRPLSLEFLTAD